MQFHDNLICAKSGVLKFKETLLIMKIGRVSFFIY